MMTRLYDLQASVSVTFILEEPHRIIKFIHITKTRPEKVLFLNLSNEQKDLEYNKPVAILWLIINQKNQCPMLIKTEHCWYVLVLKINNTNYLDLCEYPNDKII